MTRVRSLSVFGEQRSAVRRTEQHRSIRLLLSTGRLGTLIWVTLLAASCRDGRAEDFTLSATTVKAVEGGPFVLTVAAKYTGKLELRVYDWSQIPLYGVQIDGSPSWMKRRDARKGLGASVTETKIAPGQEIQFQLLVHHDFAGIREGTVDLRIAWPVCSVDGKTLAEPATKLKVTIAAADKPTIADLVAPLADSLARVRKNATGSSLDDLEKRVHELMWTEHEEIVATCCETMSFLRESNLKNSLRAHLAEYSARSARILENLVRHLSTNGRVGDGYFFERWPQLRVALTTEQIRAIDLSKDLWIRALNYRNYASQLPKGTKESLLDECDRLRATIERNG